MIEKTIQEQVQELRENVGKVPRQAVEQALADLFEEVLEYRNFVVGNFFIHEDLLEQYKVVFDDDIVLRQMLERHSSRAIDQFNHVVNTRYLFALSGAMRWSNSQEASMHFSSDYKITMK